MNKPIWIIGCRSEDSSTDINMLLLVDPHGIRRGHIRFKEPSGELAEYDLPDVFANGIPLKRLKQTLRDILHGWYHKTGAHHEGEKWKQSELSFEGDEDDRESDLMLEQWARNYYDEYPNNERTMSSLRKGH